MIGNLNKLISSIDKDELLNKIVRPYFLSEVQYKDKKYPIIGFSVGNQSPEVPVLFLTGGVHGLERIGAQLAWSLLKTTIDRLKWDQTLQELFKHIRLSVIPLVNPTGYTHYRRCNSNGVDLMRNSPVIATEATTFLLGGHRYSNRLPWFQGNPGVIEKENETLFSFFKTEASQSHCVVSLDFHSGFGMKDRIWFPYSYTRNPFDELAELHALTHLFEQTHPYHIYQIEPQSEGYLLNGDIWDHLYLDFKKNNPNSPYLPLTLEMGSWSWVRKNPLQLFKKDGIFNPVLEHRIKRTYRRHHLLYDFLLRALRSHHIWSQLKGLNRNHQQDLGLKRWY